MDSSKIKEDVARQFLVSGRVQKVGYRAYIHKQALKLELKGFVRNLKDGRVEVVARGPRESIDRFDFLVRTGPDRAEVSGVEVKDVDWNCAGCRFEVQPDGEDIWPKP